MLVLGSNFIIINSSGFERNRDNTYYVGGTGPGNFTKIQDAINAANPGDTIYVYNNTYFENVVINKELKLLAKNNDYPTIDGLSFGNVVNITAPGVEFRGFTIMHGGECTPELYAGINIDGGNAIVADNNITRNSAFGVRLNSSNSIIKDNVIKYNCGEGVYTTNLGNNNLIYNNYLMDNTFGNGNNIWNISKTPGTNIIGGPYLGGNYWHDYHGRDLDSDGLGDTDLPHNNSGHIINGGDFHPLTNKIFITSLSENWNLISLPFDQMIDETDIIVSYDGTDYTWAEAIDPVNGPLIVPSIYGWDRTGQIYALGTTLEQGYGYWLYAYQGCELRVENISTMPTNYITDLSNKWNIVGLPSDEPVNVADLTVNYDGTDYSWSEAIDPANGPLIVPDIYGWDRVAQNYISVDTLEPGNAYWIYSYQDCVIKGN